MSGKLKWVLIGVAVGAVAAPTAAVMAANSPLTAISNLAGTRTAAVTSAGQLQSAESDPKNAVFFTKSDSGCGTDLAYTVPAGKALVLKTGTETVQFTSTETAVDTVSLSASVNSQGYTFSNLAYIRSKGAAQNQTIDFGSQVVLPTGALVYLSTCPNGDASVWLYGYLVPASAAPPPPSSTSQAARLAAKLPRAHS